MIKINENEYQNEYQIEEKDMLDFLNSLEPSDEIDTGCDEN